MTCKWCKKDTDQVNALGHCQECADAFLAMARGIYDASEAYYRDHPEGDWRHSEAEMMNKLRENGLLPTTEGEGK